MPNVAGALTLLSAPSGELHHC